ncbi:lactosylceramide 1,3-N-acetyl-beta-D-glucosaminyltransferase [Lycaon pictus]|uniref:Hexosyltransferase n=2 Tax=Canis lupus TaxID=9612 RepID=A0A8C0N8G7_CANLF|nr:lactosylceramide 1,3-N-acetyl-beta-D-glucosaminyltransferase [Canis lupus familiaris]XP_005639814.1 lactosylceramide 1,3-N-acetyl-beta-D-glucosaminyltransferase [Canis lupus familiaris]XP_005639815.1 lactosylceramide 1,3-N-acetyl-beta-D-glucosaminyltransferase [Canis lupus familiaris]XP_005639817.1 lactosylceramide 1,3-N-acetyl-beta-D-glucosaminyltransferase [Canis lupus familiaris]XP_005639818.1 lactosylceramide 1,3-N-acetyl-beta-D-glucosaminyltransferase [Canis lupus familiaris]XP_0139659|eukprot:XP_005639813.1 lactosylceramide 1,3-N-acetyl-beta-D-glucosaminyltransferase [Canis lupus familiaris]
MDVRMFVSGRRVKKWQFVQLFATCFVLSLMFFWDPIDNHIVSHMKSYSYRYLINSYDFVNDSLSLKHSADGATRYQYLINHEEKCQAQDILLLLFVKTAPENYNRRHAIRKTWGNEKYVQSQLNANIKTLFALGTPTNPLTRGELQRKLVWEDQMYNDLIQQDFADSFYNLTLKLLLQFRWANSFCPHAKFLMTADDDIFIHMPNLIEYLQSLEKMGVQDFWIGRVHRGAPPVRDKRSKYYVPYEMYQWPAYPDYTAGAAYVISGDVAAKVHEASQTLNSSLYIDDVFMGLCANKMGIVPQHHVFFSGEGKTPYHPCIYNKMMTSHGHVQDLQDLWRDATDPKVKTVSRGFFGQIYCRIIKIVLLCKLTYVDTYPCRAAFA